MNEKFSQFKDIAKFDTEENLIISGDGESSSFNGASFNYSSRFLNND